MLDRCDGTDSGRDDDVYMYVEQQSMLETDGCRIWILLKLLSDGKGRQVMLSAIGRN